MNIIKATPDLPQIKSEKFLMSCLPCKYTEEYDNWEIRISKGFSGRCNSIVPYKISKLDLSKKLSYCKKIYNSYSLPALFRIPDFNYNFPLIEFLLKSNYEKSYSVNIMRLKLDLDFKLFQCNLVINYNKWNKKLYNSYAELNNIEQHLRKDDFELRNSLSKNFKVYFNNNDPFISTATCVFDPPFAGIFGVSTLKEERRKGHSSNIIKNIINDCFNKNCFEILLQVDSKNNSAINLYNSLKFKKYYSYRYFRPKNE